MQRSVKRDHRDVTLEYRTLPIRPASIDDDDRSVLAVIASETPIPEFDWDRGEMIPRVLLASGAQFNKQVPLLDSHNRFETKNQLGSIRGIKKEDSVIVGRLFFSKVSDADDAFTKVREGHLTDVSAGFRVLDETFIPAGETKNIKGQDFIGPINVATKWRLHEGSITPIGADEVAKMRGFDPKAHLPKAEKDFVMNETLRTMLVEAGMDSGLSDDDAQQWLVENREKVAPAQKVEDSELSKRVDKLAATLEPLVAALTPKPNNPPTQERDDTPMTAKDIVSLLDARAKKQAEQAEAEQVRLHANIDASLELAFHGDEDKVPDELKRELYGMKSIDDVRIRIKEEKTRRKEEVDNPSPARIRMADHQPQDAHRSAVGTALILRSLSEARLSPAAIDSMFPEADRSKDWGDFQNTRLIDIGRECLVMDGFDPAHVRRLSTEQAAKAALGWPVEAGLRTAGTAAYHVTASFANLTLDAFKKTLQAGYTEARTTWMDVGRQAASTPDFKNINRISLGAITNLTLWADNTDPDVASMKDSKVSYAVEARAKEVNFSWQLMVNDDLNAISRAPQLLGNAAARTVNAVFWSQITANDVMDEDGVALFSTATGDRKRSNLTTGSNSPDTDEVGTMKAKMRLMRGHNTPEETEGDDTLNLVPAVIAGPPTQEGAIDKLVFSSADPAVNLSNAVHNPFSGLKKVIEPLLEAESSTAYYLFASTADIDTVEVTFLQGQEQPVVSQFADERRWSRAYTVVQTYQAKAMDHRGVQKHTGV